MLHRATVLAAWVALSTLGLPCASLAAGAESTLSAAEEIEFFEKRVRPVLAEHCHKCHSAQAEKLKGGLRVDGRGQLLAGGDTGPAIRVGDPDKSRIIEAVRYGNPDLQMPPKSKLNPDQIRDLETWVRMGAPWGDDVASIESRERGGGEFDWKKRKAAHWAWQPIRAQSPPAVMQTNWVRTAVDSFVLAGLEAAGLRPAPRAEKGALIRRLSFDLTGLPPTPAEVEAFLADDSPNSLDGVVDRLLGSPHFGERWARHWLDVVRFSETLGHEFDYTVPNAWRYRDYVIRAFNADVPFDKLAREHIAGDLLSEPRRHPTEGFNESVMGTAFFWWAQQVHSPVDVRMHQLDLIDNQIDVVTKAFLGMTVSCARCHDHKFDAISTKDYYALFGILSSSRYRQATIESRAEVADYAEGLRTLKRELAPDLASMWESEAREVAGYLLGGRQVLSEAKTHAPAAHGDPSRASPAPAGLIEEAAAAADLDPVRLRAWVRALEASDVKDRSHPAFVWRELSGAGDGRDAENAVQLRSRAVAGGETRERDSQRAPAPQTEGFADFRDGSNHGWLVEGDAFGMQPMRAGDFQVLGAGSGTTNPPIRLNAEGAMSSGGLSARLQGALRSPTFTIAHRYIHVRQAGQSARLNVVIDNFVIIRDPIYGGLKRIARNPSRHWVTIDVDMWRGHKAYLEFLDASIGDFGNETEYGEEGWIEVERVLFSNVETPPKEPSGSGVVDHLLSEGEPGSAEALAKAYERAVLSGIKRWRAGLNATEDWNHAPGELKLLAWMVNNGLLDERGRDPTRADSSRDGDGGAEESGQPSASGSRVRAALTAHARIAARIRPPQRVPAMIDGLGMDERVFVRGNPRTVGETVPRRFLAAVAGEDQAPMTSEGSGRLELAERLLDPSDPLPARVFVNRVWHHLFGRGIVSTVDNFGVAGRPPTHPELLDWLAEWFRSEGGWSTKGLIRLLVTSSAYQMSSYPGDPVAEEKDPSNDMIHRMRVRRLESEAIRDAILAVSGRLDRTLFGPSVPVHLTAFMDGRGRPGESGPLDGGGRRSLYVEVRRNFMAPLMVVFDAPVTGSTVGRRSISNVPAQALILLNDPFVRGQAELWARKVLEGRAGGPAARVRELFMSAFGRAATDVEVDEALAFLDEQGRAYGLPAEGTSANEKVWADLCHVLFNVKEFIFIN